ncbi:hypothetical protein HKX48_002400, partial [Thoreauomyces humboldtii]
MTGSTATSSPATAEPPLPAIPPGRQKKILLVLIHGFLGSEESFFQFPHHLVKHLVSHHGYAEGQVETRMFPRYDTRGHNARSVQKLIDWLLVYGTTGRYECVLLLAHSMGGLLAADAYQYMYALHKEKVEGRLGGAAEGKDKVVESTDETEGEAKEEPDVESDAGDGPVRAEGEQRMVGADALPVGNTDPSSPSTNDTGPTTPSKKLAEGAATVPNSSPAGSGLAAVSSWFRWRAAGKPGTKSDTNDKNKEDIKTSASASSESTSVPPAQPPDLDGFEGTAPRSPDSEVRFLVNIRGIITFDSPFYGLQASVITQAGTNKAVAIMTEGFTNARAYIPLAVEHASAIAPRTIPIPTGMPGAGTVWIPTAWVVNAAKKVVGTTPEPPASATDHAWPEPNADDCPPADFSANAWPEPTPCGSETHASSSGKPSIACLTASSGTTVDASTSIPAAPSPTADDTLSPPITDLVLVTPPAETQATSSSASSTVATVASMFPGWARYAIGGAAMAATAYAVAPFAVAYIPASMIASSLASAYAISGAEQIRDHLHFLYPLVNSQTDMHARVKMLQREMEERKRLTFRGFFLALPPHPAPKPATPPHPTPPQPPANPEATPLQMEDLDAPPSD